MPTLPPLARNRGIALRPSSPLPRHPPGRALCRRGIAAASSGGRSGSNPSRQHLPLVGSALHTCRPCAEAERLQRAGAATKKHVLAFKSNQGKLENENVRGRRDLRPRNCLARFALYKGGEYPRECSAHAFPCSWKLVTVCIGRVVFVGVFFCLFFISAVHAAKHTPS